MLGHRALTMEDYGAILKRRWWIIVIPAVVLPIVAVAIALRHPARICFADACTGRAAEGSG